MTEFIEVFTPRNDAKSFGRIILLRESNTQ